MANQTIEIDIVNLSRNSLGEGSSSTTLRRMRGVPSSLYRVSTIQKYSRNHTEHHTAGHTAFKSKVTLREERLPVGLGIVSGRGSDVFLADMISDMEADSTKAEVVGKERYYAESVFAEDGIRGDFSVHEPQGVAQQMLSE